MITNFENITSDLTDEEKKIIPILIKGFNSHSKENPIKAPQIVKCINEKKENYNIKSFSEVRLRKLCNFIRSNSLIPLISTSEGYYVSYNKEEIHKQIESLNQRANAILSSANGLTKFI